MKNSSNKHENCPLLPGGIGFFARKVRDMAGASALAAEKRKNNTKAVKTTSKKTIREKNQTNILAYLRPATGLSQKPDYRESGMIEYTSYNLQHEDIKCTNLSQLLDRDSQHEQIVLDLNPCDYTALDTDSENNNSHEIKESSDTNDANTSNSCLRSQVTPRKVASNSIAPEREYSKILSEVVFSMSGFINPKRAELKELAISMGARYESGWKNGCTHLICGYKNTPLYKAVNGKGPIVREHWILECHEKKKLVDWNKYKFDDTPLVRPCDENTEFIDQSSCESTSKRLKQSTKSTEVIDIDLE